MVVVSKPTIVSWGTELRWRLLLSEAKAEAEAWAEEEEAGRGRGTGGVEMSFRAVVLSGEMGNWWLLSRRTSIVKYAAASPPAKVSISE